jgi:hypothetical protein
VHSKTLVVDDHYLSIGSANFAARALRLDSEVNLTLEARNEAERRHINRFADKLLAHWDTESVELRNLNPALYLHQGRAVSHWVEPPFPDFTWIPWQKFFDPEMSPLYPLKRAIRKWKLDENPYRRSVSKALLTLAFAELAIGLAGAPLVPRTLGYCFLLCSAWTLPIPFLPITLLAAIDAWLPVEQGIHLSIICLWIASLAGYASTRMFPTRAQIIFHDLRRSPLAQKLGERFFPRFLLAIFDPAIPLHYKVAYEGIYCMPLPWFVLVNGLLLPSVLYGLLRAWQWAWIAFAPRRVFEILSELDGPRLLILLVLIGVAGIRLKSHKTSHKSSHAEKTENPFLQHS